MIVIVKTNAPLIKCGGYRNVKPCVGYSVLFQFQCLGLNGLSIDSFIDMKVDKIEHSVEQRVFICWSFPQLFANVLERKLAHGFNFL
ncbi:hypothetical protein D3C87_1426860 [compost metagenome]